MKKNLAVIFGGRSSEHEVSCVSVVTIAKAVDLEKYNMFLIGITKDGEWKLVEDIAGIEDGSWKESPVSAIISPDTKGGLIISQDDMMKVQPIDVIFPVLHGMYGEDGTIQNLDGIRKMDGWVEKLPSGLFAGVQRRAGSWR